MMAINLTLLSLASYLTGSIPFGFLIGKAVKGVDLRKLGSGNIGATNAGRVLGAKWGLICLALDALKGLIPVAVLPQLFSASDDVVLSHATVLSGVATIVGHMFPCWLGFRGGKGVATSLGVVAIISPWGLLVAAALFFGSFAIWRYVSLSSMLAAVGYGAFEMVRLKPSPFSELTWSHGVFAVMVPALIIIQHRANIRRLWRGEELRFQRKAGAVSNQVNLENDQTPPESP
jgi:glycerol-3-phosphate acyltransferase PlsY